MSERADSATDGAPSQRPRPGPDASTGELISQVSADLSRLIRDELQLARIEMTGKARKAGIGAGVLGAAGVLALYATGVLIACGILALALVMDAWLAALIVGLGLCAAAGVAALIGRNEVQAGVPPIPTRTLASVQEDLDAVRGPHSSQNGPAAGPKEGQSDDSR